jgi:serine protease Do
MDDWDKFSQTNFTMRDPDEEKEKQTVYVETPKKKKEPKYVTRKAFIITLIVAMLFSATIGAGAYAMAMSVFGGSTIDKSISTTNYNLSTNTGSPLSVQEIVAKNENSVVAITTESVSTDSWLGQYVTQGAGSGVIISEDGYIVTNNHVIEDASNIKVTLHDGTELTATLVATDEQTDVAVIKVEKEGLTAVTFGDSSALCVGDLAVAIGNPLGTLAGSATEGIISGLEREITIDSKTMTLVQTSASINPGNSGGGLFDQYGNLIGIVVAKSSGSDVEGLGFAIPSDLVQSVAGSLMENGYVAGRPAAGITIKDLTSASEAMQYGVQITGVYIVDVTGNNAKAAGLQPGDLIYYLDDTKITSGSQLISLIQKHQIGDKVTFSVVRNNEIIKISMELEDAQTVSSQNDSGSGSGNDAGNN